MVATLVLAVLAYGLVSDEDFRDSRRGRDARFQAAACLLVAIGCFQQAIARRPPSAGPAPVPTPSISPVTSNG